MPNFRKKIERVLEVLNGPLLKSNDCFFAGGTAISLSLNEYRESDDVDFICGSKEGFRELRNLISQKDLRDIFIEPVEIVKDIKKDRYAIRALIKVDGNLIKLEIISSERDGLKEDLSHPFSIPTLSKEDLFVEKLLANADRHADRSFLNRDAIDLAMMSLSWGGIPKESWNKAIHEYGDDVINAYQKANIALLEKSYFKGCCSKMNISDEHADLIFNEIESVVKNFNNNLKIKKPLKP